jgi:hypothetical protein
MPDISSDVIISPFESVIWSSLLDISADVSLKSSAFPQTNGTLAYPLGVEYSFINRLVFLELAIFDEYEFKFVLLFIFQAKIIIGQ